MEQSAAWYVKSADGKVYGPAEKGKLVTWAEDGRINSTSLVSQDRLSWMPAQQLPELEMKWLVETEPGKVFGPFNRAVVIRLFRDNAVSSTAKAYCLHEGAVDQDPPPVERIVEKVVEKVVEVPVERIVEKEVVREVCVEVPSKAQTSVAVRSPAGISSSLFAHADRSTLAALEAAAQRELAAVRRSGRGSAFGFFGGKKR